MWDDAKQMNALAATLAVLAALGLAAALVTYVVRQSAFAFGEVVVTTPLSRANGAHLEAVIRAELTGTFFTMDLVRARDALNRVPWVRDAGLRRQWPDRLEVTIEEHEPLARFNEAEFVDTRGEVFAADSRDELPRFLGPEARAGEMTERYRAWSEALRPLSLDLAELRLSPRGGWRVRVAGAGTGLTLELGREDADARLARFITAYRQTIGALARSGTRVDTVDLRYRNGYAVRVPAFREKNLKPAA
jgi:cell division protein FtsQ